MTKSYEYLEYIINKEFEQNAAKSNQFSIRSTIAFMNSGNRMLKELPNFGIWGHRGIDNLDLDKEFAFLLSFRPSRMNIGYLPMLNQMQFFYEHGARIFCVISMKEAYKNTKNINAAHNSVMASKQIIESFVPKNGITYISDFDNPDFSIWESDVSDHIKISKVKSLLGWGDDRSMSDFNTACNMTATFLAPQIHSKRPMQTILSCGANEVPFLELSKLVSKKSGLYAPTATFSIMTQNIAGKGRMRSNDPLSIYFDQESQDIENLLLRSVSGGRPQENQKVNGGIIKNCNFAFYNFLTSTNDFTKMLDSCNMCNSCMSCKQRFIPGIIDNIKQRSV